MSRCILVMVANFLNILVFNNSHQMGGVCTTSDADKDKTQCPHKKYHKKGGKPTAIGQDITKNEVCQLCRQMKEMKEQHKESNLSEIKSNLSLTTHNMEESSLQLFSKRKFIKNAKKGIDDFQIVRGLGKGAFGRVFMIKQRESSEPIAFENSIMSIKPEEQIEENQQVQNMQISFRMEVNTFVDEPLEDSLYASSVKGSDSKKNSLTVNQKTQKKKLSTKNQGPRFYALKILNKSLIKTNKQMQQAMSQRIILEAMDHPFIVKLYYAFQTKSRLFMIVDLLAGGELFYLLRKMRKFQEKTAKFYAAQILLAIEYLHKRSIIYRDLKPENILLDSEGHVKITDFGLSKILYSQSQKTYSLCGTLEYMAPEVILGGGYTQAADWFSFGSLIYDMLTGRPPFLNNNKSTMLKNIVSKPVPLPYYISDDAKSLLRGLFKIRPEDRLGFKEGAAQIKNHKFFSDIDFDKLARKEVEPPISFGDTMKQFGADRQKDQVMLNSAGFEKWNSWHLNLQSPQAGKKTKESKQVFQGFTYEQEEDYEFDEEQIEPQELETRH